MGALFLCLPQLKQNISTSQGKMFHYKNDTPVPQKENSFLEFPLVEQVIIILNYIKMRNKSRLLFASIA